MYIYCFIHKKIVTVSHIWVTYIVLASFSHYFSWNPGFKYYCILQSYIQYHNIAFIYQPWCSLFIYSNTLLLTNLGFENNMMSKRRCCSFLKVLATKILSLKLSGRLAPLRKTGGETYASNFGGILYILNIDSLFFICIFLFNRKIHVYE